MRITKEQAVVRAFARMYEYADNIITFCEEDHWDVDKMLNDKRTELALAKCIEQLGVFANHIGKVDEELFDNEFLRLRQMRAMRNISAHEYYKVSHSIVKATILHDVPKLRDFLVDVIPYELLKDPNYIFGDEFDAEEIYRGIINKVTPSKEK